MDLDAHSSTLRYVCVTAEEKLLLNATNKHQQVLSGERTGRISVNNEQGFRRQQRVLACDSCESNFGFRHAIFALTLSLALHFQTTPRLCPGDSVDGICLQVIN
jgi:hypothetical protein